MKTSCFGSRISCSFRKALRAAATSGRSCSAACMLFFSLLRRICGRFSAWLIQPFVFVVEAVGIWATPLLSTCPQPESLLAPRVTLFEEAKELSAGRVERALLIFGPAVGDERSTLVIEDREYDLVRRPLSEPRVLMQFRDDLATENPQVIAVRSQGFARRA